MGRARALTPLPSMRRKTHPCDRPAAERRVRAGSPRIFRGIPPGPAGMSSSLWSLGAIPVRSFVCSTRSSIVALPSLKSSLCIPCEVRNRITSTMVAACEIKATSTATPSRVQRRGPLTGLLPGGELWRCGVSQFQTEKEGCKKSSRGCLGRGSRFGVTLCTYAGVSRYLTLAN